MSETDEPQGFEHTHNRLNINQNSQSLMTFITSKIEVEVEAAHNKLLVVTSESTIDCRITLTLRIMIM